MKKRLRKKRKLGEYAEYGFEVQADFNFNAQKNIDSQIETIWNHIITFCESRNLTCCGSSDETSIQFIINTWKSPSRKYHPSPTQVDKDSIIFLLKKLTTVKNIKISSWFDVWNDDYATSPKSPRYLDKMRK